MLLRTFTPETLTGSQNFDTFHKPTNVELLANQLVLMETTVTTTVIIQVCINSIASTVTFIVLYYYNMVLLSRHSADTGGGESRPTTVVPSHFQIRSYGPESGGSMLLKRGFSFPTVRF